MRIRHLNCGTMCPICRRLINGDGSFFERGRLVCHCLLVEPGDGRLILVDTGFGLGDCADPERFSIDWRKRAAPRLDPSETAIMQLNALGYAAADVTDIILTHLDCDHVGGVTDFPTARVHVHQRELQALAGEIEIRQGRYIGSQMPAREAVHAVETGEEEWFGLPASRPFGADIDILMVALPGHTPGHCGVAVSRDDGNWLLHAGDAFYQNLQVTNRTGRPTLLLRVFQKRAATDNSSRADTLASLRDMKMRHGDDIEMICSHDPQGLIG